MKRAFDIGAAAIALFMLLPALLVIAIWIKLDSNGPILFLQRRVGRNASLFQIIKFRTMRTDQPINSPQITSESDPRITRAGHWIRKSKIDELPQLWNVLTGDMSIVGPRPEVPKYVELYSPQQAKSILSVRPGLTDLASITYRNESYLLSQSADPEKKYVSDILPDKIRMNMDYSTNNTFWGDMKIILMTLKALASNTK